MYEPEIGPSTEPRFPWHAIYTRYQHEKSVAQALRQTGFEVFLPLQTVTRHWKDRSKKLELPLFPSYVFLRGGIERHCEVTSAPGVCWFVGNGVRPAEIPAAEIEAVKRVVEQRLWIEPHPFLKCGDYVRVRYGPLQGIEGILVRKKDRGTRLVISVEILQRAVAVDVNADSVERIRRTPIGARAGNSVSVEHDASQNGVPAVCRLPAIGRIQCGS